MYKTIVVKYSPKAKEMAARIEDVANQMEQEGFEFVSCSIMPSSKGILIFRKPGEPEPDRKVGCRQTPSLPGQAEYELQVPDRFRLRLLWTAL